MKQKTKDALPLLLICISLSLIFFLPSVWENDVLRVGYSIIHVIFFVGYLVGISIIREIQSQLSEVKKT